MRLASLKFFGVFRDMRPCASGCLRESLNSDFIPRRRISCLLMGFKVWSRKGAYILVFCSLSFIFSIVWLYKGELLLTHFHTLLTHFFQNFKNSPMRFIIYFE